MSLVAATTWAELLDLQAIRVVAPVLLGDVVALLAVAARERDLGPDLGALFGHVHPSVSVPYQCVAGTGLEPVT